MRAVQKQRTLKRNRLWIFASTVLLAPSRQGLRKCLQSSFLSPEVLLGPAPQPPVRSEMRLGLAPEPHVRSKELLGLAPKPLGRSKKLLEPAPEPTVLEKTVRAIFQARVRSKALLEITVRKRCPKSPLEITIRSHRSLYRWAQIPFTLLSLATCMDMHGFTVTLSVVYI